MENKIEELKNYRKKALEYLQKNPSELNDEDKKYLKETQKTIYDIYLTNLNQDELRGLCQKTLNALFYLVRDIRPSEKLRRNLIE